MTATDASPPAAAPPHDTAASDADARPESDYSRPTKRNPRGMRTGYTTGATAAAAAKAAVILMLSGAAPAQVSIPLPGGNGRADFPHPPKLAYGTRRGRPLLRHQGRRRRP